MAWVRQGPSRMLPDGRGGTRRSTGPDPVPFPEMVSGPAMRSLVPVSQWIRAVLAAAVVLVLAGTGFAAEAGGEPTRAWKSKAEAGWVKTSGNTDTTTLAGKLEVSADYAPDRFFGKASGLYGTTDGEETANRWYAEFRYERLVTERLFGFATADYRKDKFAGYDARITAGPGVGYDLVKNPRLTFKALGSLLYTHDNFADDPETDAYASGKAAGDLSWKATDTVTFGQYADFVVSFEDADRYFVTSDTRVEVRLGEGLSLALSYGVAYQNDPPGGAEKTDTVFLTSLVVGF